MPERKQEHPPHFVDLDAALTHTEAHVFTEKERPRSYVEHPPLPNDLPSIRLAEGITRLIRWDEGEHILREYYESGQMFEDMVNYRELDLSEGKQHIKERFGLDSEENIFIEAGGSDEIINKLGWLLPTSEGTSRLTVIGPCFPNIINVAKRFRSPGSRHQLGIGSFYSDLALPMRYTVRKAVESISNRYNLKDSMIYLCNPATPTGDCVDKEELEVLASLTSEKGIGLVVDEAFRDSLPDNQSLIPLTKTHKGIIVISSLSKIAGLPGVGIGYAAMSDDIVEKYRRISLPYPRLSKGLLSLANKLLDPNILIPHLEEVREKIVDIKSEFLLECQEHGIKILPTDTRVPIMTIDGEGENFYETTAQLGLEVVSCAPFFDTHPDMSNRYVRISMPASVEEIPEIVRRIEEAKRATW